MSGLNNQAAGLLTAVNENTLALASLKFDFSLVKVEAPQEYKDLGEALSVRRRNDAEDGSHHRTARRLGALFEQLVPSTPHLTKAYGLRSSEIIKVNGINPKGSAKHGPFEAFVGTDGTALWAAATSGVTSIGIYLLACLLARAWNAQEAASIWVEIVEERRKEITYGFRHHETVSESSRSSVYHDISRKDLAGWDASARAWLQSADSAKFKQQTQLMLIVKNVQLPYKRGSSTYLQVIEVWRQAMMGLEQLLCGKPQEILNPAILLGFSAWHIYPDFIILGSEIVKVNFDDDYVDRRGIATISTHSRTGSTNEGTKWSLALSHLRYYGDPIITSSEADFSRVTIQQLHVVALGSILDHWEMGQRKTPTVANWFLSLWEHLSEGLRTDGTDRRLILQSLEWFRYLAEASRQVISSDVTTRKEGLQLLAYGRRRAKAFLGKGTKPLTPFFGLSNPSILAGLSEPENNERAIAYLRELSKQNGLRSSEAFISFDTTKIVLGECYHFCTFMTAVPHTSRRKEKVESQHGNVDKLHGRVHARWLLVQPIESPTTLERDSLLEAEVRCYLDHFQERGEESMRIYQGPVDIKQQDFVWQNPPLLFDSDKHSQMGSGGAPETDIYCCPSLGNTSVSCQCFDFNANDTSDNLAKPVFWKTVKMGRATLFLRRDAEYDDRRRPGATSFGTGDYLEPSISSKICTMLIRPKVLAKYLHHAVNPCTESKPEVSFEAGVFRKHGLMFDSSRPFENTEKYRPDIDYLKELAIAIASGRRRVIALRALALATEVYFQLKGATISLKVVDCPLDEAAWLDQYPCLHGQESCTGTHVNLPALRRANTLSCIVHFESGTLALSSDTFNETLAIASGNSLFVIGSLLSDPCDTGARERVQRIIGNVDRPGICLLVAPVDPKIRLPSGQYNSVNHLPYDGERINSFETTSLHLSFTDWTFPIEPPGARTGLIDQEVYFIEAVISVLDSGKWVADLDILSIDFQDLLKLESSSSCPGHVSHDLDHEYTSIDGWEELLDGPTDVGFFRARGNWAARLAAVSILCQKGQVQSIGIISPESFCLQCLVDSYGHVIDGLAKHESPLPSICVD